jgi:hypothetical protein
MKIALGFRYAQTILNLAFARFWGQFFSSCFRQFKKKQKQDQKQLGIRFAHKAFLLATLGLGSNIESSLCSVNLL